MDDRQIMYLLCQKESKKIDGIINEYYKDQKDANIIKKGLNLYFFNKHQKDYPKNREWKKFINAKGLFEYFSFQNKIISIIFKDNKNGKDSIEKNENVSKNIREIINRTVYYINDSRLSQKSYQSYDSFEDSYLFYNNDFLDQPEIFANKLEEPTKKEKDNLTKEDVLSSLANQTRKYCEIYNNKHQGYEISTETFLSKINLGRYTKDVEQKIFDEDKKELQKIIDSDEDRDKDIENYNKENANPPLEELSTNYTCD